MRLDNMIGRDRYNDYSLINDVEMDEVGFDELPKKFYTTRRCKLVMIVTLSM